MYTFAIFVEVQGPLSINTFIMPSFVTLTQVSTISIAWGSAVQYWNQKQNI